MIRTHELLAWVEELDHRLPQHRFLLALGAGITDEQAGELYRTANRIFSGGDVIRQQQDDPRGWPYGPNLMFSMTAKWVARQQRGHWFWCEPDCIPTRPGWLNLLDAEYRRLGKMFLGTIHAYPSRHLNGCMVYPQDAQTMNPYMANAGKIPWDMAMPLITMRHGADTPLIHRLLADPKTNTPMSFPTVQSLSVMRREAVVFHGCKDGTAILRLRERDAREHFIARREVKLAKKTELTVVLPFCQRDAGTLIKLLGWIGELNGGQPLDRACLLSWDSAMDRNVAFEICKLAEKTFKRVHTTEYPAPEKKLCPQTVAFAHAARHMAGRIKRSWFWMEADTVPLRADWLAVLESTYRNCAQPFMGPIVAGKGHCNGTAVYPANAVEYIGLALEMTYTAWDTAMRPEMIGHCHDCSDIFQHVWGVVAGKFHPFLGEAPRFSDGSLLGQIQPGAVLFHRCKDGSLIQRLKETMGKDPNTKIQAPEKLQAPNIKLPAGESLGGVRVEIFIVSYLKDLEWLKYCLASIEKFATGFSGVTVLVPSDEAERFGFVGKAGVRLENYAAPANHKLRFLAHEIQKCRADEWCPKADYIAFVDSDCIFTERVTPEDYFVKGKPVLLMQPWGKEPWKAPTDSALGWDTKHNLMCRHPAVHYRWMFAGFRKRVEAVNKMKFDDYVISRKPDFPPGFSEFCALGSFVEYAYVDMYHFIDISKEPRPRDLLTQFWSHSPPDKEQNMPSVGGKCVPMNIIRKVLA